MDINNLTPDERERFNSIRSCIDGDLTNAEAAARVRLTVRQVRRLKRKVEASGEAGTLHGLRGSTSLRKTDEHVVKKIVAHLKKKECKNFGPAFAQRK